jgi:DNA polymerase III subunit epsilon
VNPLQWLRLGLARRRCGFLLQKRLLSQRLPPRSTWVRDLEMVALHFATTGLDPSTDRILAAGWVQLRGDSILLASARDVQVRSPEAGAPLPGEDTDEEAPMAVVLEQLLPELAGRVIVAHAAAIERGFLNALLRHVGGVPMPNPFVGTLALEQRLIEAEGGVVREQYGDLTLEACRARRGLAEYRLDSAGTAAIACAELLLAQVSYLGGASRVRLRELQEPAATPPPTCGV